MNPYSSIADEFYINLALRTTLPLPQSRETILDFFASLQRAFPRMSRFHVRDNREVTLESDKSTGGRYGWFVMEPDLLLSGYANPEDPDEAIRQHRKLLELCPFHLSINHLDVSALDLTMGFDFYYQGNHHEVVAQALGGALLDPAILGLGEGSLVDFQPDVTFSLDEEGKILCRLSIEPRTTLYQIHYHEYGPDPLSVWFSLRRQGPLDPGVPFTDVLDQLADRMFALVDSYLRPLVLEPLARTIASRE